MRLIPPSKIRIGSQVHGVFLLLTLAVGIGLFRDYGLSWDEQTQRNSGIVFLNDIQERFHMRPVYIPQPVPKLEDYRDREFGASFETFLFAAERLFGFSDYRPVFLFRHLMNFLFFWIGIVVFGSSLRHLFRHPLMPLAGCLMLLLHPRIFADAFYNSKDIILMVFFIFSFRLFLAFRESWKLSVAFWFALLSALAFNVRPAGILIPVAAFLVLLKPATDGLRETGSRRRIITLLFYLLFFVFFVWMTNPYFWDDPLSKIFQVVVKFLKYDTSHTAGNLLFLGNYLPTASLPWYYLPVWIAVTTPVFYLILLLAGLITMIRGIPVRDFLRKGGPGNGPLLFVLGWWILPLLTAILFRSTLYDGWRHFYFIWPALVITGMYGLDALLDYPVTRMKKTAGRTIRWVVLAALISTWGFTAWFIYRWHPHQYTYFNVLAPEPGKNFELDYWGLSYRDGLEELVRIDPSGNIRVKVLNLPGYLNSFLLEPSGRNRLWYHHALQEDYSTRIESYYPFPVRPHFLNAGQEADYYLSNFRDTSSESELEKYRERKYPYTGQIFSCRADRLEILGIYRIQP
jgi:hypothetical protein